MIHHPPVTALLSLPGFAHNVQLHGLPHAGVTYLRSGTEVVDIILGDRIEGTSYASDGLPRLTAMNDAELVALGVAVEDARTRLAGWTERPAVA